jgi:hypothetical protein
MKKIIISDSFLVVLDSLFFRVIILFLGLGLILFYGMLLPAAIVNLPLSLLGVLYSLTGVISGILCIIYFFKKKKSFLAIIIPTIIFMVLTLSQVQK